MKGVSELYGRHAGADIYVIGTGASLRVFPTDFFEGKVTVGLNMAWKCLPVNYAITIHPDLNIPDCMPGETPRPGITWVVGLRKTLGLLSGERLAYAKEHYYFFEYDGQPNTQPAHEPSDSGRILDWVRQPIGDQLYVWSSISQAGVNLAANLGAKNIILIGCDNCALGGNHHAHAQHTRWKGVAPDHRYRQYYEGLAEVRGALRQRGVNLLNMTPFVSLSQFEEDFARLCTESGQPEYIANRDISPGAEQSGIIVGVRSSVQAVMRLPERFIRWWRAA